MDVQKTTFFQRITRIVLSGVVFSLATAASAAPEAPASPTPEADSAPIAASAAPPPAASLIGTAPPSSGDLLVVLHHSTYPFTAIEVTCPEFDFRERAVFANRATFFQGEVRLNTQTWPFEARISIPSAATCELHLKGGPPVKIVSVVAGSEMHCISERSLVRCTTIPLL